MERELFRARAADLGIITLKVKWDRYKRHLKEDVPIYQFGLWFQLTEVASDGDDLIVKGQQVDGTKEERAEWAKFAANPE